MQLTQILFLAVIVVAFWFLLIRPQQQQQKRQQEMISKLREGDQIVTVGGIFATIVSVEDDRIRVAVADGSELEVAKRAVGQVLEAKEAPTDEIANQDEPEIADMSTKSQDSDTSDE